MAFNEAAAGQIVAAGNVAQLKTLLSGEMPTKSKVQALAAIGALANHASTAQVRHSLSLSLCLPSTNPY